MGASWTPCKHGRYPGRCVTCATLSKGTCPCGHGQCDACKGKQRACRNPHEIIDEEIQKYLRDGYAIDGGSSSDSDDHDAITICLYRNGHAAIEMLDRGVFDSASDADSRRAIRIAITEAHGALVRAPRQPLKSGTAIAMYDQLWRARAGASALTLEQIQRALLSALERDAVEDDDGYVPDDNMCETHADYTGLNARPDEDELLSVASAYLKLDPPHACESCGNLMLRAERYTCGFCKHQHPVCRKT